MGFNINFGIVILFLISTSNLVRADSVSRRNLNQECNLISEIKRMDCGYGGINRENCLQQGCCFTPTLTRFIPWCFYLNQTYADPMVTTAITFRETTTVIPTTYKTPTVKPAVGKRIPIWLRNLLKKSEIKRETTITKPTSTTVETITQNSKTLVIEDELRCQNTYRLYNKIKGDKMCDVSPANRISCVEGKLKRKIEESECSACTRLNCCYDPIMKKSQGTIMPHCYKHLDLETTTTVEPTSLAIGLQGQSSTQLNQNPVRQQAGTILGVPASGQSSSANFQRFLQYYQSNPQFQNLNNNRVGASSNQIGSLLQNFQNGGTPNRQPMISQNRPAAFPNNYNPFTSFNRNPNSQGTSSNINSALSLFNRPQSSNTGTSSSNNIMNLLSLINKPKVSTTQSNNGASNPSSSANLLLSLLQKPKAGSSSSMKDMLMAMYKQPGNTNTANSNAGSLTNILSLLSKPKTGPATTLAPAAGQSSSGLSSIISSLYGNKAGSSSSSLSNIQNMLSLMKRPTPATDFENKALPSTSLPNAGGSSMLNLLSTLTSSKTGNSPYASLLSSLGKTPSTGGSTTNTLNDYLLNKYLPSTTTGQSSSTSSVYSNLLSSLLSNKRPNSVNNVIDAIKPVVKPTVKPVLHKPEIGAGIIPILYENETRPLPDKTCYPQNCGHRATDRQVTARIVGGHWTGGIAFWPWMASLRRTFYDDDRYTHICGATLISRRWILSAGHCFVAYEKRGVKLVGEKEKFPSVYAVHLGKYYRDSAEISMQVFEIESFEAHPDYDYKELRNDIAVARLKEPARYTNYVQPVCLPAQADSLIPREITWVTGWGETLRVGDQNKSKLKELFLPLISSEKCRSSWPNHFDEAWICTEGAFQEDACAGDSGGPLVKRGEDERWDVVGVAIAGTRTCSTDRNDIKPGIYTKVAYYRDFIDVATGGACDEEVKLF